MKINVMISQFSFSFNFLTTKQTSLFHFTMAKKKSLSNESSSSENNDAETKRKLLLEAFAPKPIIVPENNTVFVELRNHYPTGGRFPRFNATKKNLYFHLHESVQIPPNSWKFVNLNVSIKMPDYYVYTLCHITSFLASKGLVIVPINLAKGSIVRLIVELHNISNQNWKLHNDTTLFEI